MDEEFEPASTAGPASLKQVKQSVHSDLQYVSLQMNGEIYGGWYRLLPDGQMELLALANMHCERRPENTPIEQARGMLQDFIRVARAKTNTNGPAAADATTTLTLGDLLYADKAKTRASENDWLGLVRSIAAGDQLAMRGLYEHTHRIVFTLIMGLTDNREIAEELTLDVFHGVWRRAPKYDAADGSVVAWIMNQARATATGQLGLEQRKNRVNAHRWPTDVLCPSEALWGRVAQRIAAEMGAPRQWAEPEWEEVALGISCKLLATDTDAAEDRASMLIRLAPGVEYPPHRHAGVEELHLLHGELLIDGRTLYPGDYNRAEPGSVDKRVWSETGCTCVLITSTRDAITESR